MMKFYYFLKNMRILDAAGFIPITVFAFILAYYLTGIALTMMEYVQITVIMAIYLFYALSINNYFDWKNDKTNPKKIRKNPISAGKISRKAGFVESKILLVLGTVLCALWFPSILPVYLIIMANVFLYSYKFKYMPLMDLVSHGIYVMALFLFPAMLLGFSFNIIAVGCAMIFFISNVAQLENEIRDYESDKKSKINTTAVYFGLKPAAIFFYISNVICIAALATAFIVMGDIRIALFIPMTIASLFKLDVKLIGEHFEKMMFANIFVALIVIVFA